MTTSRRETEEKEHGGSLPSQPGQRRGTQVEGAVPTREKAGQPCGPTQAEAHSVSLRQWHHTKTKSNPIQRRESNVTIVYWGRTQTGPETGDRTWRLGIPQDPGIQRHSSATRASQQVPDKGPGEQPPQRSYGGRTTKDKPQPISKHWKREGRTQGKIQENSRRLDHQTARATKRKPGQGKGSATKRK